MSDQIETEYLSLCPFCGARAEESLGSQWFVQCRDCNVVMGWFDTPDAAIAAWNQRTPPAAPPAVWMPVADGTYPVHDNTGTLIIRHEGARVRIETADGYWTEFNMDYPLRLCHLASVEALPSPMEPEVGPHDGWIPVEKQLPAEQEMVEVRGETFLWQRGWRHTYVSHWRPLRSRPGAQEGQP